MKSTEFLSRIISSPKLIWIEWIDAATHGGPEWVYAEDTMKYCMSAPPLMNTIGFILNDTEDFVALTDTIGTDETGSVNVIPKAMIKTIKYLRGENDGMSTC